MQKEFSACLEKQKTMAESPNLEGAKTNFPKVVIRGSGHAVFVGNFCRNNVSFR